LSEKLKKELLKKTNKSIFRKGFKKYISKRYRTHFFSLGLVCLTNFIKFLFVGSKRGKSENPREQNFGSSIFPGLNFKLSNIRFQTKNLPRLQFL